MDCFPLVEKKIFDGEKFIAKLRQSDFPVFGAFWLKTSEASQWYFYIASSLVEKEGIINAYGRVLSIIRQMEQPFWIDQVEVKLIEPTNPIAEAVHEKQMRYPKSRPTSYGGMRLGGVTIDGAYLYPLPVTISDKP